MRWTLVPILRKPNLRRKRTRYAAKTEEANTAGTPSYEAKLRKRLSPARRPGDPADTTEMRRARLRLRALLVWESGLRPPLDPNAAPKKRSER